jgi:hypothetical protein
MLTADEGDKRNIEHAKVELPGRHTNTARE